MMFICVPDTLRLLKAEEFFERFEARHPEFAEDARRIEERFAALVAEETSQGLIVETEAAADGPVRSGLV